MAKLLIVYHSRSGNTGAMAEAVNEGVLSAGAMVSLKKVTDAKVQDLFDCDTVIFGTPNNFDYMSGPMKEFFDQVWIAVGEKDVGKVANKPYSTFTSAGSGNKMASDSIDGLCNVFNKATQFKFTKSSEDVATRGRPSPEVLAECRELGRKMAQL